MSYINDHSNVVHCTMREECGLNITEWNTGCYTQGSTRCQKLSGTAISSVVMVR